MAGFGMGVRHLESEMVKHGVQILIVQQPSQAENAYRKLLASLTGERKFVGVDCEGINGDKLALMVQVRGYSLFIFSGWVVITSEHSHCTCSNWHATI